jgi:hypothetical protein
VIYCVVPQELADELYDKLVAYYAGDENVKVIVDRRESERRDRGGGTAGGKRQRRDRRRPRVPGEFPPV